MAARDIGAWVACERPEHHRSRRLNSRPAMVRPRPLSPGQPLLHPAWANWSTRPP